MYGDAVEDLTGRMARGLQEGGDVNMLPNVASAPMMAGTPMGGDLSEPMAPAQAELSPAEMQEAQGALMQIIQIIQMLINQGMSEEEIQQFLAQYGITEEELDQAAAILGVDIDALMAGEQRMPMAEGGESNLIDTGKFTSDDIKKLESDFAAARRKIGSKQHAELIRRIASERPMSIAVNIGDMLTDLTQLKKPQIDLTMAEQLKYIDLARDMETPKRQKTKKRLSKAGGGMTDPLAPARIPRTPEMIIFSINNDIENLYKSYTDAVKSNKFEEAQAIADEIDGLQQQIINLQESKVPPMSGLNMRFGGSATGK